jgi:hypothetical protein
VGRQSAGGDLGESFELEGKKMRIVPERDYYRGIPTILNSETAALMVADKISRGLAKGKLFRDTDFGPKSDSDHEGNWKALYFMNKTPPGYADPKEIYWKHTQELSDNPQFVSGGASAGDVKQGQIGDCWLIGARSVVATRDELLRGGHADMQTNELRKEKISENLAWHLSQGVFPPIFHMYRKHGLYVLRFFKDFKWRYVLLDNRLPVFENGSLVFGKCKSENEFWVPIIEKAYAKLHGCYQTLISGFLDDALSDLTGLVSEKIKMQVKVKGHDVFNKKQLTSPDAFWDFIMKMTTDKCMMGCSAVGETEGELVVDGERTGVLKGHAYGVIDAFTIEHKDGQPKKPNGRAYSRMLRIRNPWGKLEWRGKWSDNSEELDDNLEAVQAYIDSLDEEEKFFPGADDGTFLMCYSDFRSVYSNLFVSVDFPTEWTGVRFSS